MGFSQMFSHSMWGNYQIYDLIIGEDMDKPILMVSTVWGQQIKQGETMSVILKDKTYYELHGNLVKITHKSKKDAINYHQEMIGRFKNGHTVDNKCKPKAAGEIQGVGIK